MKNSFNAYASALRLIRPRPPQRFQLRELSPRHRERFRALAQSRACRRRYGQERMTMRTLALCKNAQERSRDNFILKRKPAGAASAKCSERWARMSPRPWHRASWRRFPARNSTGNWNSNGQSVHSAKNSSARLHARKRPNGPALNARDSELKEPKPDCRNC